MKRYYLFNSLDELILVGGTVPVQWPKGMAQDGSLHEFQEGQWVMRLPDSSLRGCALRSAYGILQPADWQLAGKAWELLWWSEHTRYCGCCGGTMTWHSAISRRCIQCGQEVWPQLNTAIIVLVHKGEEVLLVKARTFRHDFFGLVAGFVETGESLEECVAREVMEETSLQISNIRYFGSQPWPFPLGLMVGFHADWVSGDIRFADGELTEGGFFRLDALPRHADGSLALPGKESMARRLIDDWLEKNVTSGLSGRENNGR